MDIVIILLLAFLGWQILRVRYQRARIALLGRHLASLQLERHMETLTEGYTRAIREEPESRQLQVLDMLSQTERAVAAQAQSLADAMQKENLQAAGMSTLALRALHRALSACCHARFPQTAAHPRDWLAPRCGQR